MTDVRWNDPLEAVHTDGRVVPVELSGYPDKYGDRTTTPDLDGVVGVWRSDGSPWNPPGPHRAAIDSWRIRNVRPAWRTSDEQLDRMDALVKRLAAFTGNDVFISESPNEMPFNITWDAREIIAAREPVDPRFEKVLSVTLCSPHVTADGARRLARDVLAALDA